MADQVFTPVIAKWRAYLDGSIVAGSVAFYILKTAEADSTLRTRASWAAVKAATGNAEANFANYAAITGITPTITQGTGTVDADLPDQLLSSAGTSGAPQNLAKVIICWRPTTSPTDANTVPLAHCDYPETANGADLELKINNTGLFHGSAG